MTSTHTEIGGEMKLANHRDGRFGRSPAAHSDQNKTSSNMCPGPSRLKFVLYVSPRIILNISLQIQLRSTYIGLGQCYIKRFNGICHLVFNKIKYNKFWAKRNQTKFGLMFFDLIGRPTHLVGLTRYYHSLERDQVILDLTIFVHIYLNGPLSSTKTISGFITDQDSPSFLVGR